MRATAAIGVVALLITGCRDAPEARPPATDIGDVSAGSEAIDAYGCGSCHTIPGISGADALVGPPLDSWSGRSFIAGSLTNNFDNLVLWLRDPDGIRPGTAMPDLDISESDARDIAAYLLSLE